MPHLSPISRPISPTLQCQVRNVLGDLQNRPPPKPPTPKPPLPSTLPSTTGPILVWFRGHDLRVDDHIALDTAVASGAPVVALYVLEQGWEEDSISKYITNRDASSQHSQISTITSNRDSSSPFRDSQNEAPPVSNLSKPQVLSTTIPSWGPQSPNGGFTLGRVQRWYLHYSLLVLQQELAILGITLIFSLADREEDTSARVTAVAKSFDVSCVLWNRRYKPHMDVIDNQTHAALKNCDIPAFDLYSECLLEPYYDDLGSFDDFQSYMRYWMDCVRIQPPDLPHKPILRENVHAVPRDEVLNRITQPQMLTSAKEGITRLDPARYVLDVGSLNLLKGIEVDGKYSPGDISNIGCVAAKRTLRNFLSSDFFRRYANGLARRDGLVTSKTLATSRLSPHVRFGEISPRVLFHEVVQAGQKSKDMGEEAGVSAAFTFIKNMCLKEFGCYTLHRYPTAAFKPIMPEFEVFPWARDEDGSLKKAWECGTTGFPILDAAMRQLIREGWIHNRMRFLAATFFCKYLLLPWPMGAGYMVRTLVDGDEGCNTLGWQWTVGCNTDSFPFSTLVNPVYLCNNTQSKRDAAAYVKKYVPELSALPDHMVFTPWKATREQLKSAMVTLVVQGEYRTMGISRNEILYGNNNSPTFYPTRIVSGREARIRARNAMALMRRIFAAQRQCRILVEDQITRDVRKNLKHSNHLHVTSFSSVSSCTESEVTALASSNTSTIGKVRSRDQASSEDGHSNRKRRRVTAVDNTIREEPPCLEDSVPLLVDISTSNGEGIPVREPSQKELSVGKSTRRQYESIENSDGSKSVVRDLRKTTSQDHNAKRPRSASASKPHASDDRLSVDSLVNKTQPHDSNFKKSVPFIGMGLSTDPTTVSHPPVDKVMHRVSSRQNNVMSSNSYGLSKTDTRTERLGASPFGSQLDPSNAHPNVHSPYHSTPNLPRDVASGSSYRGVGQAGAAPPFGGYTSPLAMAQGGQNHLLETVVQTHGPGRSVTYGQQHDMGNDACGRSITGQASNQKAITAQPSSYVGQLAPEPRMFHHSVAQAPFMAATFVQPQQNQGVVVYGNPGGQMPLQPGNFPSAHGIPHVANSSQNYLGMPSGNSHAAPGGQVFWYQPMNPYMDLRFHSAAGSNIAGLMRPTPHGVPDGSQVGYEGMVGGNGIVGGSMEQSIIARQGPSTPGERINIARKMAAMDYKDDTLGGKNWEQWQAIALHLLNQYEFSEDTDRQTSKAYVRLCVLKDELRYANPTGPRVTVNHCKEVFRILRLPVTGEWDRRGHGGVRGPYCYGCVKRRPHS